MAKCTPCAGKDGCGAGQLVPEGDRASTLTKLLLNVRDVFTCYLSATVCYRRGPLDW